MSPENTTDLQTEVIQSIKDMNTAWMQSDFDKLRDHFHEDMIIVAPDNLRVGVGIDACIASYESFMSEGRINSFKDKHIAVDIIGNTAAATYEYDVDYEINKKRSIEEGKEVLVFSKVSGQWKLLWRMIVSASEK
ncbi:YybH family protein [Acidobacteriota bacterium]